MLPVSSPRFGSEETLQKRVSCNFSFFRFFSVWVASVYDSLFSSHFYRPRRRGMHKGFTREVHDSLSASSVFFSLRCPSFLSWSCLRVGVLPVVWVFL
jgi:hypothetical protein